MEAADHNAKIFMENGNNLQNVMNVNYGTGMTPGSEFQQIKSIKEILGFIETGQTFILLSLRVALIQ